jgi:hypothetical protein
MGFIESVVWMVLTVNLVEANITRFTEFFNLGNIHGSFNCRSIFLHWINPGVSNRFGDFLMKSNSSEAIGCGRPIVFCQ